MKNYKIYKLVLWLLVYNIIAIGFITLSLYDDRIASLVQEFSILPLYIYVLYLAFEKLYDSRD